MPSCTPIAPAHAQRVSGSPGRRARARTHARTVLTPCSWRARRSDTLIIVLRKKSEQLSFLHLWHHFSILIVWGWVVNTWPSGSEGGSAAYAYGAWINSCIHVIMYAYYGVTAAGIRPPVAVKKSVTTAQLTQFASCILHAITALLIDSTPIFYNAVQVAYHIGMLKLFLPLLLGAGKKKAAAGAAGTGKDVARTPAQKEVTNKTD